MGDRYYITGVQIGMIKAFLEEDIDSKVPLTRASRIKELLDGIEDKQFIGRIEEQDKDKLEVGIVEKHSQNQKKENK